LRKVGGGSALRTVSRETSAPSMSSNPLWHVIIKHCKEQMNQFCHVSQVLMHLYLFYCKVSALTYITKLQETPFSSCSKRKRMYNRSGSEAQNRPKGSMAYLNKASSKKG
jgi:hypothetical protein